MRSECGEGTRPSLTIRLDTYDAIRSPGTSPYWRRPETASATSEYRCALEIRTGSGLGFWEVGSAGRDVHCQELRAKDRSVDVQTWTMAVVFGERLKRRFSAKLTAESENQAGFLAGVAAASTTWLPLVPMTRVWSQTCDQKRSMSAVDH